MKWAEVAEGQSPASARQTVPVMALFVIFCDSSPVATISPTFITNRPAEPRPSLPGGHSSKPLQSPAFKKIFCRSVVAGRQPRNRTVEYYLSNCDALTHKNKNSFKIKGFCHIFYYKRL